MSYKVYILKSEVTNRYYIGQTENIEARVERHNLGYVKSTKNGKPWRLIITIDVKNRSEALVLEKKIKKEERKDFS